MLYRFLTVLNPFTGWCILLGAVLYGRPGALGGFLVAFLLTFPWKQ